MYTSNQVDMVHKDYSVLKKTSQGCPKTHLNSKKRSLFKHYTLHITLMVVGGDIGV